MTGNGFISCFPNRDRDKKSIGMLWSKLSFRTEKNYWITENPISTLFRSSSSPPFSLRDFSLASHSMTLSLTFLFSSFESIGFVALLFPHPLQIPFPSLSLFDFLPNFSSNKTFVIEARRKERKGERKLLSPFILWNTSQLEPFIFVRLSHSCPASN